MKGVSINQVEENGNSALHGTSYFGREEVVRILLTYGANKEIINKYLKTAEDEFRTPTIRKIINEFSIR